MPSWKTAFGSTLKTEDLEGKPVRAVVESVDFEEIGQDKEKKLVMRLVGKDKGLVLNKTKCEAMTEMTGVDDWEQWAGTQIVMEPGKTTYGGKQVGCINIRAPRLAKPAPKPEPSREPGEDDVPFDDDPFAG